MTNSDRQGRLLPALAGCDIDALVFIAEMDGVQLDHLAVILGVPVERARGVVLRWRHLGLAESARLGPGPPWIWATRPGLAACGLRYAAGPPALSRLAHVRAVTAIRLTLQATTACQRAHACWRGGRRIRAAGPRGHRAQAGPRNHLPDGELHWPPGAAVSWAGECWAIRAELARRPIARISEIMHELLTRTGDYGDAEPGPAPGPLGPARVLYFCSPAALPAVAQARDQLGGLGARVEIRNLPPDAGLPLTPGPQAVAPARQLPAVNSARR
jgi:hypothetical protein